MAKKRTSTAESIAYEKYLERTGFSESPITTALIDMDGVLFDSMKNHSAAWKKLSDEIGWKYSDNEFFLYEGMTGAAIIRLLMKPELGREDISDEEAKEILITWLETEFEGGRHQERLDLVADIEVENMK